MWCCRIASYKFHTTYRNDWNNREKKAKHSYTKINGSTKIYMKWKKNNKNLFYCHSFAAAIDYPTLYILFFFVRLFVVCVIRMLLFFFSHKYNIWSISFSFRYVRRLTFLLGSIEHCRQQKRIFIRSEKKLNHKKIKKEK